MCILHVHQLTVQISTNGGLGNAYNDEQQNKSISTCLNHMKGSKENKNVVSDYQAWALPQYEDSCGRGFLFLSMFYNQLTEDFCMLLVRRILLLHQAKSAEI